MIQREISRPPISCTLPATNQIVLFYSIFIYGFVGSRPVFSLDKSVQKRVVPCSTPPGGQNYPMPRTCWIPVSHQRDNFTPAQETEPKTHATRSEKHTNRPNQILILLLHSFIFQLTCCTSKSFSPCHSTVVYNLLNLIELRKVPSATPFSPPRLCALLFLLLVVAIISPSESASANQKASNHHQRYQVFS